MSESNNYPNKEEFFKLLNHINGIFEGMEFDHVVNDLEISFIKQILIDYGPLSDRYPFNQFFPLLHSVIEDGKVTEDELKDVQYLLGLLLRRNPNHDYIAESLNYLHGIIQGIMADSILNEKEVNALSDWIFVNRQLKGIWPYDEIEEILLQVTADNKITADELRYLEAFFAKTAEYGRKINFGINKK